jgi:hypothetical protein
MVRAEGSVHHSSGSFAAPILLGLALDRWSVSQSTARLAGTQRLNVTRCRNSEPRCAGVDRFSDEARRQVTVVLLDHTSIGVPEVLGAR